jgi:hypothetical protein
VGVSKRISGGAGWTKLLGIPVARFRVEGTTLVYQLLPVRDELRPEADGTWSGRGLVFGMEFCRFSLNPA